MKPLPDLMAPLLICCTCIVAAFRGVDIYDAMVCGAKKGLRVVLDILPALIVLFPAISIMQASGLPELLCRLLSPVFRLFGLPEETALLMLLRPMSGSGALAAASELIAQYGADSLIGRTAAVMIGSSETTFYVIAVYFAAAGVKNSRWAVPAALCADLACFISSAWICRLLWA